MELEVERWAKECRQVSICGAMNEINEEQSCFVVDRDFLIAML
jgi:hypothetical protein